MAEESPGGPKRRRIIHWNPEAGKEQARRGPAWPRVIAWTLGGAFALLLAAGLVIRGLKLFLGPEVFTPAPVAAVGSPSIAEASSAFISQAKAEQAFELVSKALKELRRVPADHPSQLEQLITMERLFTQGETLLRSRDFGRAFAVFEALNPEIESFTRNVKAKGEARQGYDSILLRIKELELARSLAPGALEAAFEAAGAGSKLLADGNFAGAKKQFDAGFAQLKRAEEALTAFVKARMFDGQRALAAGEKAAARQAFEQALAKSPGLEAALQGLKRAETSDRVHALLQQGAKLELQKQFKEAAEAYKQAFALDGFSAAAQEGQSRSARLEKETRFASAKAAADEAIQARDWNRAIAELQNALKVTPQNTEVQAQLKTARANAHQEAVQKALAKAFDYEKAYQWSEAREAYSETLKLDADHAEAKEGYTRVGTVIRALLQYQKYIEAAEQLANRSDFQGAIRRFNEAMAVKPSYLVNSDRVQQLHAQLMEQNKPVEVTFKSDGSTWVQITNFKAPQKFDSEVMRILPGDYEVIGRRKGYRDINLLLQVRAGTPPPLVTVICNVPSDQK